MSGETIRATLKQLSVRWQRAKRWITNPYPVTAVTIQFLEWCCAKLEAQGERVLPMVWDNASWHTNKVVHT